MWLAVDTPPTCSPLMYRSSGGSTYSKGPGGPWRPWSPCGPHTVLQYCTVLRSNAVPLLHSTTRTDKVHITVTVKVLLATPPQWCQREISRCDVTEGAWPTTVYFLNICTSSPFCPGRLRPFSPWNTNTQQAVINTHVYQSSIYNQ